MHTLFSLIILIKYLLFIQDPLIALFLAYYFSCFCFYKIRTKIQENKSSYLKTINCLENVKIILEFGSS